MFKVGEIIVCIRDDKHVIYNGIITSIGVTNDKCYEVIEYKGKPFNPIMMVHIINDRNESQNYQTYRFVTLAEYRKMKINKIWKK